MPSRAEKQRSCAKRNPHDSTRRQSPAHSPELGRPIDEMPLEFGERLVPFGNSGYVVLYP
jgi:hypothetical protein